MPETAARSVSRERIFTGLWLASLGTSEQDAGVTGQRTSVVAAGGRCLQLDGLASDARPGTHAEHGVGVVFDGVLHNRDWLHRSLGSELPYDVSDASLVFYAYRRWGEELLANMKGIFAFCIWDGHSRKLIAARDRVGVYPLFYARHGGRIYLSTTTDAFGALPGPGLKVDRVVLAGLVGKHHPEVEESFFSGIRRVPPGHLMVQEGESIRLRAHWNPAPVGEGADWVGHDEVHRFGELLDQAVGRAIGRGSAGIYLSGGLDSVSVAAAALEHSQRLGLPTPHALSLLFPGDVNEEQTQRGVSEQLGLKHTTLGLDAAVGPDGLLSAALALSATSAAPLQNVWLPAYRELGLLGKRAGCEVILTGGGGDEWLTVTPLIAADLIRSGDITGLAHYLIAIQRSLAIPRLPLIRNVVWGGGLRPILQTGYGRLARQFAPAAQRRRAERRVVARRAKWPGWLTPDPELRAELGARIEGRAWRRFDEALEPKGGGFYFAEMQRSLRHPLFAIDIEEIFENGRRLGMMQYDIYWDADLIEFLYRVPPHLLNAGGRSKGLVRNDMARRFPDLGFDRQKKLISRNFFCNRILEEGEAVWQSLGGAQALAELGVVDPDALDRFVQRVFDDRDAKHVDDLWRILSLESWVRPRV